MKTDYIRIRLTKQEKDKLMEHAKKMDMTMSDYVKYCCLVDPPKNEENEKEIKLYQEIKNLREY